MERIKVATVWLEGCSGCHMSFLDLDEWLFDLAARIELVYSPLVDIKTYPTGVDVALVEGAVGNQDQQCMIQQIRDRTQLLIAFGDCAITSNVPGLRNKWHTAEPVLRRAYLEGVDCQTGIPNPGEYVPALLEQVKPIHEVVPVDLFLPGCPPPAPRIRKVLEGLLQGQLPQLNGVDLKFG